MTINTNTAAYKLFNIYYECRVAAMHLVSDEELSVFGSITNGQVYDRAMAMEENVVLLNIPTIADLHNDGVDVKLTDPTKSREIYELIAEHIGNWEKYVISEPNHREVPEEDLRKLDNLATSVLQTAQRYMKEPVRHKPFFMETNRKSGRIGRFTEEVVGAPVELPASNVGTGTPVADAIARANFKRRGK